MGILTHPPPTHPQPTTQTLCCYSSRQQKAVSTAAQQNPNPYIFRPLPQYLGSWFSVCNIIFGMQPYFNLIRCFIPKTNSAPIIFSPLIFLQFQFLGPNFLWRTIFWRNFIPIYFGQNFSNFSFFFGWQFFWTQILRSSLVVFSVRRNSLCHKHFSFQSWARAESRKKWTKAPSDYDTTMSKSFTKTSWDFLLLNLKICHDLSWTD